MEQKHDRRKALTLTERVSGLRSNITVSSTADISRGHRKLEAWRSQPPFDQGNYFSRRLALDGINEDDLICVLGDHNGHDVVADLIAHDAPWQKALEKAFAESFLPDSLPFSGFPRAEGFLVALQPLINVAFKRLRAGAQALSSRFPEAPLRELFRGI